MPTYYSKITVFKLKEINYGFYSKSNYFFGKLEISDSSFIKIYNCFYLKLNWFIDWLLINY